MMTDNVDMPSSRYNLMITWLARMQMKRSGITLEQVEATVHRPDAMISYDQKSVNFIRSMEPCGIIVSGRRLQGARYWAVYAVQKWNLYEQSSLFLKILRLPYRWLGRFMAGAA